MDSFQALIFQLNCDEEEAARIIFERFVGKLVGLARSKIADGVQHRVDAEDVVQSAYRSFFRRNQEGLFEIHNWQCLWGLLSLITLRKCAKQIERAVAQQRNVNREVALYGVHDASCSGVVLIDREPTPDDALMLVETVEVALQGFDADDRQVIELSLQGLSTREICERLQRAERSVRRLRERVRNRLERMMQEDVIDKNDDQ
ncbi:MAG: hypothetical protein KDB03_02375 [Planctomycetales bacterium]|nr:hypothetical protein [Planctomycetales bacterium]